MNLRTFLTLICAAAFPFMAAAKEPNPITNVTPQKTQELLKKNPAIIIIDIRTPKEFASGHLPNAVNIDMKSDNFRQKLAQLDRKKTYVMHCRSGGRSKASLKTWKELGFKHVLHLNSGFLGWQKAGLPVTQPKK